MAMLDLGGTASERWFSVTIQVTLLAINTSFLLNKMGNSFILVSFFILICIFALQAVSSRFLILWPVNGFMQRPTPNIDTWILYLMIIFSGLFLFMGASENAKPYLSCLDSYLRAWVLITGSLFVVIFPLYWWKWGKVKIRGRVANDLSREPYHFRDICPFCRRNYADFEHKTIAWDRGEVAITCATCPPERRQVRLNTAN